MNRKRGLTRSFATISRTGRRACERGIAVFGKKKKKKKKKKSTKGGERVSPRRELPRVFWRGGDWGAKPLTKGGILAWNNEVVSYHVGRRHREGEGMGNKGASDREQCEFDATKYLKHKRNIKVNRQGLLFRRRGRGKRRYFRGNNLLPRLLSSRREGGPWS